VNVAAFRKLTDYVPSSGAPEPRGGIPFPYSPPLPFGRPPLSVGIPTRVPPSGAPEYGGPFDVGPRGPQNGEGMEEKKPFPIVAAVSAALFFL
jgi:hypothetical protein